ncbi:MAG: hypothetical protein KKD92_12045 [Proteobacteria bacterium]|nr:hypothetical protein [Pseudomonadota bacterium]
MKKELETTIRESIRVNREIIQRLQLQIQALSAQLPSTCVRKAAKPNNFIELPNGEILSYIPAGQKRRKKRKGHLTIKIGGKHSRRGSE